jgi:magnesium transporter
MIDFYKTTGDKLSRIDGIEENCWVSAVSPTEEELFQISAKMGVGLDFLRASLDEEETSRIETAEGSTLILIGIPCAQKHENTVSYTVAPMSIIITEHNILTVCLKANSIISDFSDGLVRNVQTAQKTRFVLQILMRMSARFLQYLRQINKITSFIENQLYSSLRNKELVQLFDLGKSLVYFSASLKANEITLEKILRGRVIRLSSEEHDLLEDVLIEVKQAVDMSGIYSSVLSGTVEAFSTVRSNNINHVMKLFISVVIVLAIPVIISVFYGISQSGGGISHIWFPAVLSAAAMLAAGIVLHYKKMY